MVVEREGGGGDMGKGISNLWHVGVQEMWLSGANVRHGANQSLPETQQVVDAIGRELP